MSIPMTVVFPTRALPARRGAVAVLNNRVNPNANRWRARA